MCVYQNKIRRKLSLVDIAVVFVELISLLLKLLPCFVFGEKWILLLACSGHAVECVDIADLGFLLRSIIIAKYPPHSPRLEET